MIKETEYGLTDEVKTRLSAPIPQSQIKSKSQGGATIRFTDEGFVRHRLDEAVGVEGWQDDYTITPYSTPISRVTGKDRNGNPIETLIIGSIVCRLKVFGVMKSGTADLELTPRMYGTPATNGQARAFKRAAMKFGVAAELWDDEEPKDNEPEQAPAQRKGGQAQARTSTNNTSNTKGTQRTGTASGPSENQINYLTGEVFQVPRPVVEQLTGGRDGTASKLIDALGKIKRSARDYEDDPDKYIQKALAQIGVDVDYELEDDED